MTGQAGPPGEGPPTTAEIADRLYALPPRDFVAERDAAVAKAREAGDSVTAAAVAKLRRPTVAAWLVNLLALRRPELVAELAELASALRAAQENLDGEQLRELTAQRRATVSALVAMARSLALEADPEASDGKLPLAEVERTLNAALADREVAESVKSGRLIRAVGYEGFGELPRARLRVVEGGTGEAPAPADPGTVTRQAAQAELAEANAALAEANQALERATAAQRDAKQALADIEAQLAELTARRAAAVERLAQAEADGLAARRAVVAARRRLGEAEAVADQAGGE
ncbi:MAG TPA: hypothetical protein VIL37_09280 [Natronosporangium sp.]